MVKITSELLAPQPITDGVERDDCGAIVSFVSTIRDNTHRRRVVNLEIQPFDNRAKDKLGRIAEEVKLKWQIRDNATWSRPGKLKLG